MASFSRVEAMGYVDESLTPDEKLLYSGRVHWIVYAPGTLVVAVSFLFLLLGPIETVESRTQGLVAALALFLVGLPLLLKAWILRFATELAVTSERVIAKFGLITRRTVELNHHQVESLSVGQSISGRLLNYGHLTINGTGGVRTPIPWIDDPLTFRRKVLETVEGIRRR